MKGQIQRGFQTAGPVRSILNKREQLETLLNHRILILDGAMGTMIQAQGLDEAGFRGEVALTRAVWAKYVAVPEGVPCQDEAGRLWDVLWMCRVAYASYRGGPGYLFQLHVRNDNRNGVPPLVTLKAVCGFEDGEPCLTIMLPTED